MHRLDHDVERDPVVHRLAAHGLADFSKVPLDDYRRPQLHLTLHLGRGQAEVDDEGAHFETAIAVLRRGQVRRSHTGVEDARKIPFGAEHGHPLRHHVARVVAAHRDQAHPALVVDVRYDEADLVHVGGDHQFPRRCLCRPGRPLALCGAHSLAGDHIAQGIDVYLISQRRQFASHDFSQSFLPPRNTGTLTQLTQQIHWFLLLLLEVIG